MNNLEKLKLPKMKENINNYLDMISDGIKTPLEAIDEMVQMEMNYREDLAIVSCVKVANFPFQRSLQDFDFSFQPSLDRKKIEDLATLKELSSAKLMKALTLNFYLLLSRYHFICFDVDKSM